MAIVFIHKNFGDINVYDASTPSDMKKCILKLTGYVYNNKHLEHKLNNLSEYIISPTGKSIRRLILDANFSINQNISDDDDSIQYGTGFYVTEQP